MKKSLFVLILALAIGLSESQAAPAVSFAPASDGYSMEEAVINVAAVTGKAVVSISSEFTTKLTGANKYSPGSPYGSPYGDSESLRRFFEDFFGELPQKEFKRMGLGSGVIINADGYILTNEHVVSEADKITVTLPDGRQFKGEVKGKDRRSDLAVIKINASNLPSAVLGDSDGIRIGQWVVAIGNPFAFALQNPEPTVTTGVISALHRSLGRSVSLEKDYNDLIQTDAAINPGNSGGPLVNLKGEVIGINVAIFSTSGGYQGIGFAVPVNSAKRILTRLIEGKKIVYGWLGVTVQDLNDDLIQYFGLSEKTGALVAKVLDNSPAGKAGLQERDIIKQFDGKPVNNVRELLSVVGSTEVGRRIKFVVMRDKKLLTLEAVVGERPQDLSGVGEQDLKEQPLTATWRGLKVIEDKRGGVVVADVEPGSPAEVAGITLQDEILEINKIPVENLKDYKNATAQVRGNALVKTHRGYFLVRAGGE